MEKHEGSVSFIEFLQLPDIKKYEMMFGPLKWHQKLTIRWWLWTRRRYPDVRAEVLFENIRKGRF